jgi:Leucine-rich repeat (LRR) protein
MQNKVVQKIFILSFLSVSFTQSAQKDCAATAAVTKSRIIRNLDLHSPEEITATAAYLWIPYGNPDFSPFHLFKMYNPQSAHRIAQKKIEWKFSFQDLINAGGTEKLQTKDGDYTHLSLTSLDGFKEIPNITALESIYIKYNHFPTIAPHTFNSLTLLKILTLESNGLTKLDPKTFSTLTLLQSLYLNDNQLTTIAPDTFKFLTALKYLNLKNNPIPLDQRDMIKAQVPAGCRVVFE